MYSIPVSPCLKCENEALVLTAVDVRLDIVGLLARTRLKQTYRNEEEKPIEAVYTFPLPMDGVLTSLVMKIGEKSFQGKAVEKSEAREQYEDAVAEGDTPIMLERLDNGLYTLNLANILPKETIEVEIEFAEILVHKAGEFRYELPTTLAPRYGNPEDLGLEPHQIPEYTLNSGAKFCFSAAIEGPLATASLAVPTHPATVTVKNGTLEISLVRGVEDMDRDLVLTMSGENLPSAFGLTAKDGDRHVALMGFTPTFSAQAPARSVKIVVDCSGSMLGDSIRQAREALIRILDRLRPEDWFNVIRFGSSTECFFQRQVPADAKHVQLALAKARTMDAYLGGTEMEAALDEAISSVSPKEMSEDILILTDGEVWDKGDMAVRAKLANHRVFTIGIGSSPARDVLNDLAQKTNGRALFIGLREDLERAVFGHFKRMVMAPAKKPRISFGSNKPVGQAPSPLPPIFGGDMVVSWAWFDTPPSDACLVLESEGQEFSWMTEFVSAESLSDILPRLGAAARLMELTDENTARDLAVQYNLVSKHTNFLAVAERAEGEKAGDIPALRTVKHTLAAGWGGVGDVCCSIPPKFSTGQMMMSEPSALYQRKALNHPSRMSVKTTRRQCIDLEDYLAKKHDGKNNEKTFSLSDLVSKVSTRLKNTPG
ncbi:MAG: VWA domain-containing protein, partial [Deltaproteobacteria bacterium]|nr:VWA domain-containing protein [Deltaproteobacteria bacterium]